MRQITVFCDFDAVFCSFAVLRRAIKAISRSVFIPSSLKILLREIVLFAYLTKEFEHQKLLENL